MIRFHCPNCNKRLKSHPGTTGKVAKCTGCGSTMLVPEDGQEPPSTLDRGVLGEQEIPQLGAIGEELKAPAPDPDAEEKKKKERRAIVRQIRKEQRQKRRTIGLLLMGVAVLGAILTGALGLIRSTNRVVISGKVTFDGQPIARGYIKFTPVENKGLPVSAEIKNGEYELTGAVLGENIVEVTAAAPAAASGARAEPTKEEPKKVEPDKGNSGKPDAKDEPKTEELPSDMIGPDAIGNKQTVTVKKGRQILNFDLKSPAPKEPEKKEGENSPKP